MLFSLGAAGLALLASLLVLNLRAAGQDAQRVSSKPSVFANATSLNGPGNIFLTASVIANPGGGAPGSVAVADFNGDAKQDIAATNNGCNSCGLTILRGNGDGTFQAPLFTANLGGPYFVAAGDINGDGKQDLVVIGALPTNLTVPAVFILLGNGDGTFTLKTTLTGFTTPNAIALGDFNGDGKLDMAVSESQPGTGTPSSVVMFLGNGDGTMQAPISTTVTGLANASFMATADFNKDNNLDLVLADLNTNHVVVLLGNGNGTFQASRSFPIAFGGYDVAVGDFNGDGIPDIAATTTNAGTVDILLGKGDGNFQPAVSYSVGELAGPTSYLAVGDFNKDGKLDIIASIGEAFIAAPSSSVAVLIGKGDGTFLPPVLLATDQEAGQFAVADFNGDGNPDWVQGNAHSHVMTLTLGNGNGTFQAGVNYALGAGPDATLADVNKDGKLDIVAVDPGSNDVRVLIGKGDGTFQAAIITPVTQPASGISTGDFNNDGNLDVVMCSSAGFVGSRSVIVMLGKGDGTFGAQANFPTGGGCPGLTLVADFNGDGKLDIAVNLGNNVAILLGNGDGTFQAAKITAALATDGFLGAMAVADLNGDGKLDLVVPDYMGAASGQVAILLGNGDGTFQAPTFLTSSGGSTWPVIADFNKDGKLDLAVANQFGTIDVFLGNGNGTFNTPLVLNDIQANIGNPVPISLAAADFNLDGNLDLLVGTAAGDNVQFTGPSAAPAGLQVFLGNGDGTFTGPQDYLAGAQSNPVLVGDFNGDGAPDVAAVDNSESFVSILLNQTPPPIAVAPSSLGFGNQLVGGTSPVQMIQVSNNGSTATTIGVTVSGDFAETNTCPVSPATLAPAKGCTIAVTFKPTATGPLNGSVTITDTLPGSPQIVGLTGTGVAPIVTLSGTTLAFGSQIVGTSSAPQVVMLSNSGSAPLTISSITITGANSGDFSQTNTCGANVNAGANCSINVTFKPTVSGSRAANVTITDNASGNPQGISLTGTGIAPVVSFGNTTSLTFNAQPVGTTSSPQIVTLTNTGNAPLAITSIAITGANSADFTQTNPCPQSPATLAAGSNCKINVTFDPTATGARNASLAVTDDASGSPQNVSLTGTGTPAAPAVGLSATSLPFGAQLVGTTSAPQAVTLTNTGNAALTITTIAVTGANSGDFAQTNTCPVSPATLAAGSNCKINVTFDPTAIGPRNASVTITDNAANNPQSVSLTGTGTAPIVSLGGTVNLNFGNQLVGTTSMPPQTITLTNTGTGSLTITSIAVTGANKGDFAQTNTCPASPATLAPGANCAINVTFTPIAVGNRAASVAITDNAAGSPQGVTLSGTGVQPAVTLSSASLSLGNQLITTTSAPQGVTVTNTGTAPVTISSIALSGANSGDFAQTNTCPANNSNLAVGAKCTINVTFTPAATGNRAASITITDNISGSPQSVSLTGTGTDFSLAAAAGANCPAGGNCTTSSIISAGQTVTYDLQISPVSGFNGTVALSCSGAPAPSTCAVSPTSAPPNGSSSYAFTVTVNNTANALTLPLLEPTSVPRLPIRFGIPLVYVLALMFLLAWMGIYRRQTKRLAIPAVALLILSLGYLTGCGGGGSGGPIVKPPTVATITVTGTSGGVNRALPLSLTINH
jgi:hypothetical protein